MKECLLFDVVWFRRA